MIEEIKLLRGDSYKINDKLTIKHPTIKEIVEYGEENYFRLINLFCLKPYDLIVQLYDAGVDYADMTNYDLFLLLYIIDFYKEDIKWLIGDYEFEKGIKKIKRRNCFV